MKHRSVLNIDTVSDNYGIDISPQDSAIPYTTVVPYGNISNDYSILSNKAILANDRALTLDRSYNSHSKNNLASQIYKKESNSPKLLSS